MNHRLSKAVSIASVATVAVVAWASVKTLPAHTLPPEGWGVENPAVTQENIGQTICDPKWSTSSIRPSSSFTSALKKKQLAAMGYSDAKPADYEEDHLVSLELGGAPADPHNLWPQPYVNDVRGQNLGAREKDLVENYLHAQVCTGALTLSEAQYAVKTNWVAVYAKMKGVKYSGGVSGTDD